jgi:hypothetical protein
MIQSLDPELSSLLVEFGPFIVLAEALSSLHGIGVTCLMDKASLRLHICPQHGIAVNNPESYSP